MLSDICLHMPEWHQHVNTSFLTLPYTSNWTDPCFFTALSGGSFKLQKWLTWNQKNTWSTYCNDVMSTWQINTARTVVSHWSLSHWFCKKNKYIDRISSGRWWEIFHAGGFRIPSDVCGCGSVDFIWWWPPLEQSIAECEMAGMRINYSSDALSHPYAFICFLYVIIILIFVWLGSTWIHSS